MARPRKAAEPKAAEKKAKPKKVKPKIDPSVFDSDFIYYRSNELIKVVEQADSEKVLIQGRDGKAKEISQAELMENYEPVKGILKSFF